MGFKNVCNGIKVDSSNYIAFSGLPNWLWRSPHINCPIYELTYSCHKLSMNFARMNPSQMPSRHESDCRCQKAGMLIHMHAHTHCPTSREGHRCWRRPLCVSALAGTLIGCRGPGRHACHPPSAAPPPPLGCGSSLPPSGSLELRYWSSAGEVCKEE